jgi:hypothetical protein
LNRVYGGERIQKKSIEFLKKKKNNENYGESSKEQSKEYL